MSAPEIVMRGLLAHYNAARADAGERPGSNAAPTSAWHNLLGDGNDAALSGFAYEPGDRPRTNAETDRAIWHDRSGLGNDGTLTGFTWGTPWQGDGSAADPHRLAFSGAQYVALPDLSTANGLIATYEVWAAPTAAGGLFSEGLSSSGSNSRIYLRLNASGWLQLFGVNDAGTPIVTDAYDFVDYRDGVRRQYAVVLNGTQAQLYVNGVAVHAPYALTAGALNPNVAALGALRTSSVGTYVTGPVSAARKYAFALTPEQVAQNFAAGVDGLGYVRTGLQLDLSAARAVRPSGWTGDGAL